MSLISLLQTAFFNLELKISFKLFVLSVISLRMTFYILVFFVCCESQDDAPVHDDVSVARKLTFPRSCVSRYMSVQ